MASELAISHKAVAKEFLTHTGERVAAIGDITFDVRDGQFISIVGPSGCGKSTLLKMISGLVPLSGGAIRVHGKPVTGPSREIGMIFQNPVLLPWKTVFENVMVPIEVLGLPKEKYAPKVRELVRTVQLDGFENSYPFELSGGMAQRAAIIRSLIHDPAILLADEPFGALDAMTREQMNVEFQRIWMESGKTILFVTHSIPEAIFLADTVVVLSGRPSTVVDLVEVDFPRPRPIEIMATDQFGIYTRRLRSHFFGGRAEARPDAARDAVSENF